MEAGATRGRLADLSIAEFLQRLASDSPIPGGGSVAALVAALAAALGRMACGFTLGRPRFAAAEGGVRMLAERLTRAAALLQELIDEDAAAYERLAAALRLPRDNAARVGEVTSAALVAAQVPLETAALAHLVEVDLAQLAGRCNPNLRSDVLAGMHLARAALHAAAENVRVNLPLLADDARARLSAELERLSLSPAPLPGRSDPT